MNYKSNLKIYITIWLLKNILLILANQTLTTLNFKKMKKILFAVCTLLILASCSSNKEKGQIVTIEQYQSLAELKENNGKRFAIIGYPFINEDITVRGTFADKSQLPRINFYEEPNGKGKMIAAFPIESGKGKNQFDTPETFTMEDVTFYDNEGNKLKYTDKMQISFTMELQTERERTKHMDKLVYYGGPVDISIDKAN